MKKILLSMILAVAALGASAQDNKLAVNAGVLFPSTLNATVGYERSFTYEPDSSGKGITGTEG